MCTQPHPCALSTPCPTACPGCSATGPAPLYGTPHAEGPGSPIPLLSDEELLTELIADPGSDRHHEAVMEACNRGFSIQAARLAKADPSKVAAIRLGPAISTAPTYPGPLSNAPESSWSEDRLQQECLYWLQFFHPVARRLIFHVPNGGLRTAKQAADFAVMGVRAGVPDLCLPMNGWHRADAERAVANALFPELKIATGTVSKDQREYHILLEAQGNRVEVVRSLAEFQQLLTEYLA